MCIHRFDARIEVEYCNTKKFQKTIGSDKGWSDLSVFLYFVSRIINGIAEGKIYPNKCAFIILTKDRDFIDDVKEDLAKLKRAKDFWFNLDFSGNSISWDSLDIFIIQVDCPNYGHGRADDLKCAFHKVNEFLKAYSDF